MLRAPIVALLSSCLVVIAAACSGGGSDESTPEDGGSGEAPVASTPTTAPSTPTATATPPPARTVAPEPTPTPPTESRVEITGDGSDVRRLDLEPGLAVVTVGHLGRANFIVTLRGDGDELLVNEIGPYAGTVTARALAAGTYLLDVEADGPWSVTLTQHPADDPSEVGVNYCRGAFEWDPGSPYTGLLLRAAARIPGTTPAEVEEGDRALVEAAEIGTDAIVSAYDSWLQDQIERLGAPTDGVPVLTPQNAEENLATFEEVYASQRANAAASRITAFVCASSAVSPRLDLDGLYEVALIHSGASNFIVSMVGGDGEFLGLVANEIGEVNEADSLRAPSIPFRFAVEADGDWWVIIQPVQ